jgi:peroxiredoxin
MKTTVFSLVLLAGMGYAADSTGVRAEIQPVGDRKPAPGFRLEGTAWRTVMLADYRGLVVLLDFWATECGGCVKEMPGFMELARTYKTKGLATVGVSVDVLYEDLKSTEEGWSRVRPFIQSHKVNYEILMADDKVTKAYNIMSLPLTYLIDKRGRVAAVYNGVVDKDNVEANIQALLKEHK